MQREYFENWLKEIYHNEFPKQGRRFEFISIPRILFQGTWETTDRIESIKNQRLKMVKNDLSVIFRCQDYSDVKTLLLTKIVNEIKRFDEGNWAKREDFNTSYEFICEVFDAITSFIFEKANNSVIEESINLFFTSWRWYFVEKFVFSYKQTKDINFEITQNDNLFLNMMKLEIIYCYVRSLLFKVTLKEKINDDKTLEYMENIRKFLGHADDSMTKRFMVDIKEKDEHSANLHVELNVELPHNPYKTDHFDEWEEYVGEFE